MLRRRVLLQRCGSDSGSRGTSICTRASEVLYAIRLTRPGAVADCAFVLTGGRAEQSIEILPGSSTI